MRGCSTISQHMKNCSRWQASTMCIFDWKYPVTSSQIRIPVSTILPSWFLKRINSFIPIKISCDRYFVKEPLQTPSANSYRFQSYHFHGSCLSARRCSIYIPIQHLFRWYWRQISSRKLIWVGTFHLEHNSCALTLYSFSAQKEYHLPMIYTPFDLLMYSMRIWKKSVTNCVTLSYTRRITKNCVIRRNGKNAKKQSTVGTDRAPLASLAMRSHR